MRGLLLILIVRDVHETRFSIGRPFKIFSRRSGCMFRDKKNSQQNRSMLRASLLLYAPVVANSQTFHGNIQKRLFTLNLNKFNQVLRFFKGLLKTF